MNENMLEELRKKKEESKDRLQLIKDWKFLTLKNYVDFLDEHGYKLAAWDHGNTFDLKSKFNCFWPINGDCQTNLLHNFVLIGSLPQKECYVVDIAKDNAVRIISSSYKEFKVSRFIVDKEAKRALYYGNDSIYTHTEKLEKDLLKEWIEYLIRICPEFADYLVEECKRCNATAQHDFELEQDLIARKLTQLKEEKKLLSRSRDEKIKQNDEIIEIVKRAQGTLSEDEIIQRGNPEEIYKFAKSYARRVNGADISKLQEAIIKLRDPKWIFRFARDVKGADRAKLKEVVIEIGDADYIMLFKNMSRYAMYLD